MSCYHPLKAIQFKNLPGKQPGTHPIRILRREDYDKLWSDEVDQLEIPCGQCAGCRMDYARDWANRLMLELEGYKDDLQSCHFLTLTIDDDHLDSTGYEADHKRGAVPSLHVLRPFVNPDTGVVLGWSHSLCKSDLQLFMKRLRRQHPDDTIRFFACGEYGERSARPHYHLILFGLHLDDDDLTFYKKSPLGYDYKNSKSIAQIWPYGYNVVAPVTWESCCYVARYMMKKLKGEGRAIYDKFNLQEPYTVMSRRPGLAHKYYEDHPLGVDTSCLCIGTERGNRTFPAPRYLEKLFALDDPEGSDRRKQCRRRSAINRKNLVAKAMTLSPDEYLAKQEAKFLRSCKILEEYRHSAFL